jgi:hypothetical protein
MRSPTSIAPVSGQMKTTLLAHYSTKYLNLMRVKPVCKF